MTRSTTAYGLLVRFTLQEGAEAAFDALVSRTVRLIRDHEPGTLAYVVHTTDHGNERVFYELYANRDAFEAHERQPHVQEFLAARDPLLLRAPEVTPLSLTGPAVFRQTGAVGGP